MKKSVLLAATVLLVAAFLLVAMAQADPGLNQYCKWLQEEHPSDFDLRYKNHGDCVSQFRTCQNNGNASTVCLCKGWWESLDFENQGQCVSFFRHLW